MGNIWTRLSQEAAKHGGPDGLKAFYAQSGRLQGIVIGGAAVGAVWFATEVTSVAKAIKARGITHTDQRKPGDTVSGSDKGSSREKKPAEDAQEDRKRDNF